MVPFFLPLPRWEGIEGRVIIACQLKLLRRSLSDYAEMLRMQKCNSGANCGRNSLKVLEFRRQEPFKQFILDFVSYEKKLVIELDGGQHAEQKLKDGFRDEALAREGFTVLRFWNHEVLANLDGVLEVV